MSFSKTIYKEDSKGNLRFLSIYTEDDTLYQKSGIVDTANPVVHSKVCTPKNVGKSNETTGAEQAVAQAESLYTKKIREGYFDNQADAKSNLVIKPMLAKDYFKEKHKIINKTLLSVQPKLDGIRCIITYCPVSKKATAKSRQNVEITTIGHILREMEKVLKDVETEIITDGELYKHGLTFQENTKLVKNDFTEAQDPIEYHIYDLVDTVEKYTFSARCSAYLLLFKHNAKPQYIKTVERSVIFTKMKAEEILKQRYEEFVNIGYEGIMVRVSDAKYKLNGRSSGLLKYKMFKDIALPIVDITPNEANPNHGTVWVEFNGQIQKTGSKISHKEREELLTNKNNYIGKTAEIRYFEETDDGKMRFAYYHGIRIDK